MFRTILISQQ